MGKSQSKIRSKKPKGDFYLFSRLPAEIRVQIWEAALPSRIINIHAIKGRWHWSEFHSSSRRVTNWIHPFEHIWVDKVPVPNILHVNRESREVGLRHYQLLFDSNPRPSRDAVEYRMPQTTSGRPIFIFESPAMIYCDLQRDLFYPQADNTEVAGTDIDNGNARFGQGIFLKVVPTEVLQRIRFWVLQGEHFRMIIKGLPVMDGYLEAMKGLRGIVVLRKGTMNARHESGWEHYFSHVVRDWPIKPQLRLIRDTHHDSAWVAGQLKDALLWIEGICHAQHGT